MIDEQAGQSTPAPTPHVLLDWTVPDHIEIRTTKDHVHHVTCRHIRHEGGFPGRIFSEAEHHARGQVGRFLYSHAHGFDVVSASSVSPSGENTTPVGEDTGEDSSGAQRAALTAAMDAQLRTALAPPDALVFSPVLAQAAIEYFVRAGWRPPLPAATVEVDDEADAWYIRILDEDVHHTTESAPVNLDWTRDGQLIGVELLGPLKRPSSPLPDSETEWGYRFGHSDTVDRMDSEKRARSEALRAIAMTGSEVVVVRRAVGPWIEVTS